MTRNGLLIRGSELRFIIRKRLLHVFESIQRFNLLEANGDFKVLNLLLLRETIMKIIRNEGDDREWLTDT